MKNLKNALIISLALTVLVFIYFLVTGQSMQGAEFWSYVLSLFAGVLVYLWFINKRSS